MKVILTMAVSANGLIATKTGSEEFLSHTNTSWLEFSKLARKVGCFIWGRKTYEAVLGWQDDSLNDLAGIRKIVISGSDINLQDGFELAHSPGEALSILSNAGFTEVIITGGSITNSGFAKAGLINEVIFDVHPYLLGEGIPVFSPADFEMSLEFISAEEISDGIVKLRYRVKTD